MLKTLKSKLKKKTKKDEQQNLKILCCKIVKLFIVVVVCWRRGKSLKSQKRYNKIQKYVAKYSSCDNLQGL
jgi:hypothetical protein